MSIDILTRAAAGRELEYSEIDQNLLNLKAGIDFLLPADAAFSTAIPFVGNVYMPQQTVASVLAFTVASSPVRGARVYVRLSADGTNAPTFAGMKEWGGSAGYDNRSGIVNELEFYYDGIDCWYFINQAIGAVAGADTTAPTANGAAVANSTPLIVSISMSESLDAGYVPASGAFTVGGHTVSSVAISGAAINLTCLTAFVNGESARTVSYTQPGTNNVRDASGNLLASFSGLSITNNVAALTAPGAPTGVTATVGNASASVSFTAPASNGGSAITGYTVASAPGSFTGTGSASPISVTGLSNGTAYTFTVTAANAIGTGSASSASSAVTPSAGATAPGQVTGLTLGTATSTTQPLTWTAPSNGGSAITDYVVQWSPAGAGTWTTFADGTSATAAATVTGLSASTSYDYRAAAVNAIGTGTNSATATGSTAAAGANPRLGLLSYLSESGSGPYSYTGTGSPNFEYAIGGVSITGLQSGVDGSLQFVVSNSTVAHEVLIGITSGATIATYRDMILSMFTSGFTNYTPLSGPLPQTPANTVAVANGDLMRLRRSGSSVIGEVSKNSGSSWTTIYTWTGVSTGALKFIVAATGTAQANNLAADGLA